MVVTAPCAERATTVPIGNQTSAKPAKAYTTPENPIRGPQWKTAVARPTRMTARGKATKARTKGFLAQLEKLAVPWRRG